MTEEIVPKKKKRVQSKQKGNGFERIVSKQLASSLAPLTFIRSPGSGARLGGSNFAQFGAMFGVDAQKLFIGDVVPTNERDTGITFLCNVECKSYAAVEPLTALVSGSSNIYGWMKESEVDASRTGKKPVLIFKWNRTPLFFATTDATFPDSAAMVILKGGIKICLLEDALAIKDFWVQKT